MARKFTRLLNRARKSRFSFSSSPHIGSRVRRLISKCELSYIDFSRIFCVESSGSTSRAYARMWGLSRIWQETLKTPPAYILEVTHRFLKLTPRQQDEVLLHELAHVPKNFSGALVGHNGINRRVQQMIQKLRK